MAKRKYTMHDIRRSILYGTAVLATFFGCIVLLVMHLPQLKEQERRALLTSFPPRSLESIITVRDILISYAEAYPGKVSALLCLTYLAMQTFAVPGTISLTLLAGAMFGAVKGLVLVACLSTLGACTCYWLSSFIGCPIAEALWPERLEAFRAEVKARERDLLNFLLFLRVTPFLPNTFLNVASPIVGVPVLPFAVATIIGQLPNNFIAVKAGSHLSDLTSLNDLYQPQVAVFGVLVGLVALVPVYLRRRHMGGFVAKLGKTA